MRAERNRHGLRNLMLMLGAAALWDANRRWNERFVTATRGWAQVVDEQGRPHNGRRIVVSSVLAAPPEKVWEAAKRSETLIYVAHPLLSFIPLDGRPLPETWQEGATAQVRLLGLGLLPFGQHAIAVARIDDRNRVMETRESGQLARIWNHTIRVEPGGEGRTLYTDELELSAGALNPLVAAFAYVFFRHRQTRWQALAPTL